MPEAEAQQRHEQVQRESAAAASHAQSSEPETRPVDDLTGLQRDATARAEGLSGADEDAFLKQQTQGLTDRGAVKMKVGPIKTRGKESRSVADDKRAAGEEPDARDEHLVSDNGMEAGVGYQDRNARVEQKNVDGVPIEALQVGQHGVAVGGIQVAPGLKGSFQMGPGQQVADMSIKTGLNIPPPNGWSQDLLDFDVPFPVPPGVGMSVGASFDSDLSLNNFALQVQRQSTDGTWNWNDASENTFKYSLKGSVKGSYKLGIGIQAALYGGAPVAKLQGGARASAGVELGVDVSVSGAVVTTYGRFGYDQLAKDGAEGWLRQQPRTSTSAVTWSMAADGAAKAAISLFAGFKFFMFKGDLWTYEFPPLDFANIEAGAIFGVRDGERFADKVVTDAKGVRRWWLLDFGLLQKTIKARKLDAAKSSATKTRADASSLLDLQSLVVAPQDGSEGGGEGDAEGTRSEPQPMIDPDKLRVLINNLRSAEKMMIAPDGEITDLMNRDETARQLLEAYQLKRTELDEQYESVLRADKEEKLQRGRFKRTFYRDTDQLKKWRADRKKVEANITKYLGKRDEYRTGITAARRRMADELEGLDGEQLAAKVRAAVDLKKETYRKNWAVYDQEFTSRRQAAGVKRYAMEKQIAEQRAKVDRLEEAVKTARSDTESQEENTGQLGREQESLRWAVRQEAHAQSMLSEARMREAELAGAGTAARTQRAWYSRSISEAEKQYIEAKRSREYRELELHQAKSDVRRQQAAVDKLVRKAPVKQAENDYARALIALKLLEKRLATHIRTGTADAHAELELLAGTGVTSTRKQQAALAEEQHRETPDAEDKAAKKALAQRLSKAANLEEARRRIANDTANYLSVKDAASYVFSKDSRDQPDVHEFMKHSAGLPRYKAGETQVRYKKEDLDRLKAFIQAEAGATP